MLARIREFFISCSLDEMLEIFIAPLFARHVSLSLSLSLSFSQSTKGYD